MEKGWLNILGKNISTIWMAQCKSAVPLLLTHWRYCSLALSHRCEMWSYRKTFQTFQTTHIFSTENIIHFKLNGPFFLLELYMLPFLLEIPLTKNDATGCNEDMKDLQTPGMHTRSMWLVKIFQHDWFGQLNTLSILLFYYIFHKYCWFSTHIESSLVSDHSLWLKSIYVSCTNILHRVNTISLSLQLLFILQQLTGLITD